MNMPEFLNNEVFYECGSIYTKDIDDSSRLIADVRSFGYISKILLINYNITKAEELHDDLGKFIADAINEKINLVLKEKI